MFCYWDPRRREVDIIYLLFTLSSLFVGVTFVYFYLGVVVMGGGVK